MEPENQHEEPISCYEAGTLCKWLSNPKLHSRKIDDVEHHYLNGIFSFLDSWYLNTRMKMKSPFNSYIAELQKRASHYAAKNTVYARYGSSGHWRYVKSFVLERDGTTVENNRYIPKCSKCSADGVCIVVHHKTYKRLGVELPSDLVALCKRCHVTAHRREWVEYE